MVRKRYILVTTVLVAVTMLYFAAASGASPAPGWQIMGNSVPTVIPPGGEGYIELNVFNLGAAASEPGAVIVDTIPSGLVPTGKTAIEAQEHNYLGECSVVGRTVTCVLPAATRLINERFEAIYIDVTAESTVGSFTDHATISGGGASALASTSFPVAVGTQEIPAGVAHWDAWVTNEQGQPDTQAGSHPYDFVTAFAMNTIAPPGGHTGQSGSFGSEVPAVAEERSFKVNLPPGIFGNTQAVPQCPRKDLIVGFEIQCPVGTQVGWNSATTQGLGGAGPSPIYNMVPPPGVAAQFAFQIDGDLVFLNAGVRTGGDNGITVHVPNIPEQAITYDVTEIWGVPADPSHDHARAGFTRAGEFCLENCPAETPVVPFLTLGTSCGASPVFSIEELGTWHDEHFVAPRVSSPFHNDEDAPVGFTGCERLQPFLPEIAIAPDTSYADTPAGLSVDVKVAQGLNPEGLQTPGLQDTTVVLPEGVVINPGQATGLVACQPPQEALGSLPNGETNEGPATCPSASKVGTDEISTPLLRDKLQGNVYVLQQNPPNLQLLITASGDGVNVKLPADVHLDENTGQLVTTVQKTPDIPFTDFKLNFSGGAQAALETPTKCGTYGSSIDFTPWSSPFIQDVLDTSRFQINASTGGSPCVWPLPFAPTMTAGATTDQAGGYTSFTMLLTRGDEQQRIKTLSFKTPEGLLGMISRVPLCQEPQAAQGTCSSASQIGHTVVGAGPGPYPFYIPQASAPPASIYLTGPYDGAPFGLSIVVPLIAGPFNLGTEVVRGRVEVDPHTSQVTITTNPLPVTEKGIPDDLRLIDAVIDRPEFMFNPTDCNPMSFSGVATSVEGATAPLASHFQMGSCQALKFQPNFKVSTSGKTSRKDGASLTAKIVYPVGNLGFNQASSQSNIQSVKVSLPKQLPSRLETLKHACPAALFAANHAACPSASVVGRVKAITPVLPVPLEGPAYFVSHGGESFPNLVLVLQGDNVTVELVGDTFINEKTGITSSTFKQIPDVPIQSFELTLPQGPFSALAANTNLCTVKGGLKMPTAFTAQNGAVIHQSTPVTVTDCAKHKTAKKKQGKAPRHGSRKDVSRRKG